jgi:hypothetical protein
MSVIQPVTTPCTELSWCDDICQWSRIDGSIRIDKLSCVQLARKCTHCNHRDVTLILSWISPCDYLILTDFFCVGRITSHEKVTSFSPNFQRNAFFPSNQQVIYPVIRCINVSFVHIYFCLKCYLLSSYPSSSVRVSAIYGHHRVSSIFLKLLYCTSCYTLRVNTIFGN